MTRSVLCAATLMAARARSAEHIRPVSCCLCCCTYMWDQINTNLYYYCTAQRLDHEFVWGSVTFLALHPHLSTESTDDSPLSV